MGGLALLGNLIWLFLGPGIFCFIFWAIAGGILAVTVVGIPFAFAAWRIAGFAAMPFGFRLLDAELVGEERIAGTSIANVLWFLLAGIWRAIMHFALGLFFLITIIGIPFGLAHLKLATVSLAPLGKRMVPTYADSQREPGAI